ncbi:MAG: hypothetical protein JWM84_4041, partial [Nocardioides sp.]|nr:hypothetical protein [Nocardioides sp.]
SSTYSKVHVARSVCDSLDIADLDDQLVAAVAQLASAIRKANGLATMSDEPPT